MFTKSGDFPFNFLSCRLQNGEKAKLRFLINKFQDSEKRHPSDMPTSKPFALLL